MISFRFGLIIEASDKKTPILHFVSNKEKGVEIFNA